jgi:hypothetical protein
MILGIYCAGNLGRIFYDLAVRINAIQRRWEKIVFIDDVYEGASFYDGAEVYRLSEWQEPKENVEIVIANGTPRGRKAIYDRVTGEGYRLATLVSPTAIVSPSAWLGAGVVVLDFASVMADAVVEDNALISVYVMIGHDVFIGAHSDIQTNTTLGGHVRIGEGTFLGLSVTVKEELSIGSDTIIGLGAVVSREIGDGVIAVGDPARAVRRNEDGVIFRAHS